MTLRVWAPFAKSVDLVVEGTRTPMRPAPRGHFEVEDLAPGVDYAFSLDGAQPRPDPRSAWQPRGVHGPSRVVDHAAYRWRVPDFRAPPLSSAILYELHVGTFTPAGTLDAAAERLDHLVALGVTHVSVMPLNAFDGERGWGYDGVAWSAPHGAYTGPDGPDAVKRFVDACHERGLAAILDVVYNHLGPSGNYLGELGPYFSDEYKNPWGSAVNLDGAHSDVVRRHICHSARGWLRDYRFDGLRVDAVHAFYDRSAVHILEQLSSEVRELESELGRALVLIAESDLNDPRVVMPREAGGYGCDGQWSDDFHHALHAVLTGERAGYYADFGAVGDIAAALRKGFVYQGQYSTFRRREHGAPLHGVPASRLLGYAQNHDQVGNRAMGDRLSSALTPEQLKTAAALVLLAPFTPMLFHGEEWGARTPFQYFTSHPDADLAEAVRSGRRGELAAFGWQPGEVPDPQAEDTFIRSKLDWAELEREPHRELLVWHQRLIALRRGRRDLADDRFASVHVLYDEAERWLAMRRGAVVVAASFSPAPLALTRSRLGSGLGIDGPLAELLSGSAGSRLAEEAIHLDPGACLVVHAVEDGGS